MRFYFKTYIAADYKSIWFRTWRKTPTQIKRKWVWKYLRKMWYFDVYDI